MERETKTVRIDKKSTFFYFFFIKIQDVRNQKHQFLKGDAQIFSR